MKIFKIAGITFLIIVLLYTIVGTSYNASTIKSEAPASIRERGWKILNYEGYEWGSWSQDGGKCYYLVADTSNPNIRYRIHITRWLGELQYYYNSPEDLSRIQVKID